jgi:hypothetical protein
MSLGLPVALQILSGRWKVGCPRNTKRVIIFIQDTVIIVLITYRAPSLQLLLPDDFPFWIHTPTGFQGIPFMNVYPVTEQVVLWPVFKARQRPLILVMGICPAIRKEPW